MIRLQAKNVWTRYTFDTTDEADWLEQLLSAADDETVHSLANAGEFPTGLVRRVIYAGHKADVTIELEDMRRKPTELPIEDFTGLRDYQVPAVKQAAKRTRGVICLPTGAGKTEVALAIVRTLPGRWLFVVNEIDLVENAAKRYEAQSQEPAGRISDGSYKKRSFVCATFQTLHRRLQDDKDVVAFLRNEVTGVIVDECHAATSPSRMNILNQTDAFYRFGLSATAFKSSPLRNLQLEGALGPPLVNISIKQLIDKGYLAAPRVHLVECFQEKRFRGLDSVYKRQAAYRTVKATLLIGSKQRNQLVARIAEGCKKPAIVFVNEVKHARAVMDAFGDTQLQLALLTGASRNRHEKINELENGSIDIIVATVFKTGVDIPKLKSLILAGAGKSPVQQIQMVGRGTRQSTGKRGFDVWDVADRGSMLEGQSDARQGVYEDEELDIDYIDTEEELTKALSAAACEP